MGATERLAQFVVDFEFSKLPEKGQQTIKFSILDTLGVALLGAAGPVSGMMTEFLEEMGGNPQARLIGSGIKTSILHAALGNGTLAHYEDFDDTGGFGHSGVVMTPTVLALGEHLRAPGKKILEAYAVGLQVGHKLANLGDLEFGAGFHTTSLYGTLAAAAAGAKLLGLNVAKTRAALGIAASMASGIMQNFGTDTKALHAGHAAHSGIMAASLAKKGFTSDPDIIEARQGFFYVFGREEADVKRVTDHLAEPLVVASREFSIKAWPCCMRNTRPLVAMFRLIDKYGVRPEQVEAIDVVTSWRPPGPLVRTRPIRGYEGKFSMQYCLATALVDRKVDLYSYSDEKFDRPLVQSLMKKVTVTQDPEQAELPKRVQAEGIFATVTLRLNDGRTLSERDDKGNVLRGEDVYKKFRENARIGGLSADKIERSVSLTKGLEELGDVTELMDAVIV